MIPSKNIVLPNEIIIKINTIFKIVASMDGTAMIVGGYVRDAIASNQSLDCSANKIDIAVNVSHIEVAKMLSQSGKFRIIEQAMQFGSFIAIDHDKNAFDITTLRKDLECDGRYARITLTRDWCEDSMRRDFTINALYCDIDGNIYDFHHGIDDIKNGIVQFIGNPYDRIREDGLRILRYFRFFGKYGKKHNESTLDAITKLSPNIASLSKERITSELLQICQHSSRVESIKKMSECGIFRSICNQWIVNTDYICMIDKAIESNETINDNNIVTTNNLCALAIAFDSNINIQEHLVLTRIQNKLIKNIPQYRWILDLVDINDKLISNLKSSRKYYVQHYLLLNQNISHHKIVKTILNIDSKVF